MCAKTSKPKSKASLKRIKSSIVTDKFPIVGIGASAGGLEALDQFLSNVPEKSGMAYVVIQHLDPTQKGMLPELLQRISKIKVLNTIFSKARSSALMVSFLSFTELMILTPSNKLAITIGLLKSSFMAS